MSRRTRSDDDHAIEQVAVASNLAEQPEHGVAELWLVQTTEPLASRDLGDELVFVGSRPFQKPAVDTQDFVDVARRGGELLGNPAQPLGGRGPGQADSALACDRLVRPI